MLLPVPATASTYYPATNPYLYLNTEPKGPACRGLVSTLLGQPNGVLRVKLDKQLFQRHLQERRVQGNEDRRMVMNFWTPDATASDLMFVLTS